MIVGKREIACYRQFLLFPQGPQEASTLDVPKHGIIVRRNINDLYVLRSPFYLYYCVVL